MLVSSRPKKTKTENGTGKNMSIYKWAEEEEPVKKIEKKG